MIHEAEAEGKENLQEPLLDEQEAADLLGVTRDHFLRLIPEIPHYRISQKTKRFKRIDLEAYLKSKKTEAA